MAAAQRARKRALFLLTFGLSLVFLPPQAPLLRRPLPSKASLANGWARPAKKPRAQLAAWTPPGWLPAWLARKHKHLSVFEKVVHNKDSLDVGIAIFSTVSTVCGIVFTWRQFELAKRESERAMRDSDEGKIQAAVNKLMQPFQPNKREDEVVDREVIHTIRQRVEGWGQHATIITGRYGSGKSVALQEALRGVQGVFEHCVEDKGWKDALYKSLGVDGLGMLKEVLCEVGRKLQELDGVATQAPILVLDIPRETRKGMDLISILAKELSSDKRGAAAHVIVCASSAAMAMAFDAGGRQRQKDIWVGDLTDDEAERLLALHGHKEDWLQFTEECGLRALDLVSACERYTGPESLGTMKADMEQEARKEVKKFLLCEFQTLRGIFPAGSNILTALKTNRDSGDGQGVDEMSVGLGASPRDVTNWIREKDAHPVIWHLPDSKYRFASELHAKVAAEILDSQSQSSP